MFVAQNASSVPESANLSVPNGGKTGTEPLPGMILEPAAWAVVEGSSTLTGPAFKMFESGLMTELDS